ncbi:MAG: extracellular solute-binding protein [Lachnospiraceae bacterium]|nr:extracellular solute-binding protein [Lachnospiraceae bacterium]MBR4606767.1 extracellular solute-binding protein [Lachnospiraceae bacterium]
MFQRKHQKGNWKGWLCTGMAALLVLGAAGCNSSKGTDATGSGQKEGKNTVEELAPEFTYVAEYLSMPEDMESYNLTIGKDCAYTIHNDYESGVPKYSIMKYSFANGAFQNGEVFATAPDNINIQSLGIDQAGNLYYTGQINPPEPGEDATEQEWNDYYENMSSKSEYHLIKLDAQGNQVYEEDFTEQTKRDEYFYAQQMAIDDQGRVYLSVNDSMGNNIMLFDENGKFSGIASADQQSWISSICVAKDGKAYASFVQYNNDGMEGVIGEIDFDGKKLGKVYKNFPCASGNRVCLRTAEGNIICGDENALYEYSFEKEEATKTLTWLDCDIEGNKINQVFMDSEGKIYAMIYDWENGGTELAYMKKVKTEDVVKREKIVIGMIYSNSNLSSKIVEFNKNNDKYRVTIKTYMDENNWSEKSFEDAIANLTNDILAGNSPDILDLGGLDIENLANKGVLEDLAPFLEKSTVLNKNDFFESILKAATFHGKIVYIPSSFTLETIAAKSSLVGDKMGWTMEDVVRLKNQYPNSELIEYATKKDIMQIMLMMNKDSFIDEETGTCHFDSKEFKDLLVFANAFPKEYDYNEERPVTPYLLADNRLLLSMTSIYSFEEIQSTLSFFGDEDVTFIGFPTYNNGNGCLLNPSDQYGMSAQSKNKEAAWAFLEAVISSSANDEMYHYGFSSLKSQFEKQKAEALEIKYVYDENGEIMKDDAGNPIVEGSGGGWSMTGSDGSEWTYEYRPITKEEVDMVEKLLDGAKAINMSLDQELNSIIDEEAEYYFSGSKSVDEVANIIQNRVNLYVQENR